MQFETPHPHKFVILKISSHYPEFQSSQILVVDFNI